MRDPYDYSTYSLDQLLDAQAHIDRSLYTERAAEIDLWVGKRLAERPIPAPPVTSDASAAARVDGVKSVLVACGVAAILAASIFGSILAFLVIRGRGQNEASKQAAIRLVNDVTREWSPDELRKTASEAFKPVVADQKLDRVFTMFRQLGKLTSLGEPIGTATATAGFGNTPSGITAEYSFPAKFTNGDATIRVSLIRENRQWKTTGFVIDSDIFLPK